MISMRNASYENIKDKRIIVLIKMNYKIKKKKIQYKLSILNNFNSTLNIFINKFSNRGYWLSWSMTCLFCEKLYFFYSEIIYNLYYKQQSGRNAGRVTSLG